MENIALNRWQWRVVLLGWITYAAFYFGRVNLATALPAIEADFRWSPEQTSALAGATLWTYAIGQLINGWLGQYVDTRRMVLIGIVGSTLVNLLFAAASTLPVMIVLWLINGFLQSMGWGPILRTLTEALSSDQRRRIAGAFGASYVVGNALTWVLSGLLLGVGHWRMIFIIPPLLMLVLGLVWYRFSTPARTNTQAHSPLNLASAPAALRELWPVLITSLIAGAVINGALLYAPTYIAQTLPLDQAALTAIIFPVCGLLGTVWLGGWMLRRLHGDALRSLATLLILSALARALAFLLPPTTLSAVVLLAGMGVTSYGLSNVLLTAVPLTAYPHLGTSLVAGLIDASHSIGGAVGSTMVGLLLAQGDWSLVFGMWTLLPLAALGILSFVIRNRTVPDQKEMLA